MATYTFQQQVYSLSQTANISFNKRFPTLGALQTYVTQTSGNLVKSTEAQNLIGDWDTIWGPYTWCNYAAKNGPTSSDKSDAYYSDNTMMLSYNAANNQYILSIAGTNGISWYGWLVEDFNTIKTVPWSTLVPNTTATDARISEGTYTGINILLNEMVSQYPAGGSNIVDFLKTHMATAPAGATMAVTGHSLGGALSPTLATYLKETQSNWDINGVITSISTYPTAGPTPGDRQFAAHIEAEMGANYFAAYNKIDMVPHAWQVSMMLEIPTLYVSCGISKPNFIQKAVDLLVLLTRGNDYQQAQPLKVLNGTCYKTDSQLINEIINEIDPSLEQELKSFGMTDLNNLINFLMEVIYQHTTAYNSLLDREAFSVLFDKATGNAPNYKHLVLEVLDEILKVFKNAPESTSVQ